MASEFQTRKLIRRFGLLDSYHAGHVEPSDYLRIAERLRCSFELEDGDPRVTTLRGAYERLWHDVHGDTAKVSLEEFVDANGKAVTGAAEATYRPVWESLFALCDQNADGELELPQLRLLLRAHGLVEPQIDAALAHIVPRGPGLSREAFGKVCGEYFAGEDLEAAGNWLFGDPRPLTVGLG
ncbi:hypothetical protein AB0I28_08550 [Phytomonospora sp. NPDC050363]|uniref:EF-hand domain-containing protein n=1 Tax=Phytomonospora sp. NPDC050363 TaxID=3155642 RepID=UPI0033DA53B4